MESCCNAFVANQMFWDKINPKTISKRFPALHKKFRCEDILFTKTLYMLHPSDITKPLNK